VAKLAADGPARLSSSVSRAWLDEATANSLAADRHGPRQDDQIVKTKPLKRSRLRILDQSLEPREPALRGTGRLNSPARSPGFLKGGLDNPLQITPDATHFGSNARSER